MKKEMRIKYPSEKKIGGRIVVLSIVVLFLGSGITLPTVCIKTQNTLHMGKYMLDMEPARVDGISNESVDVIRFILPHLDTRTVTDTDNCEANGVTVDSLGNVIVTGYIDKGENNTNFYTVKCTTDKGDVLWSREFDEHPYNDAKDVAVDSLDNVIVAGTVDGTGLLNVYDYCLVKYDRDGNELWYKTYGRKMYDTPLGVVVDSMDNIIVAGMSGRIDFTPQVIIDMDFWTIKCDSNGDMLYEDGHHVSDIDVAFDVAVDSRDNIIIVGITNSSDKLVYYTIKYSPTLSMMWEKVFSNGFEDAGSGVAIDSDDNIIVTGGSRDNSSVNYGTVKYTPDGSQVPSWPKFYDSGGKDDARGVAVDCDDNIIVTGISSGEWCTIKYDKDGEMRWEKRPDIMGGARAVSVDQDNNVIIAGYKENRGMRKYCIAKYDTEGEVLWESFFPYPPEIVEFFGPTEGKKWKMYNYTVRAVAGENDLIYYWFDWDDGTDSGWLGPYVSGEACSDQHSWRTKGDFVVRVKARDEFGDESKWSTLDVTIPKNKAIDIFIQFLEDYPHIFSILKLLLGLQPI